ncbi:acyl-CoA dehydrogenase/oxidase [Ilyonectria robusta]|uniref:acyl-CoA dehydrogenase/oxidase n=1 Tax=Ilyonectria robusta TaxID=1079257 RepID=UPI001E8D65F8|nr:acyl-CoA dehydrogenase/oxidase [Ilyonectria robusta]KAH8646462.1 acyl-CoA dehydrogenase/oxidase [Ilyonectria robusta]
MAAFIIATIHVNLCIGTLSSFVRDRPDLQDLVEKLLNFDICGQFMLTEVGHGLDARNLETRATLQPDGSFDLHTPNTAAAKAMPPTTPYCRMPRVAIVFARLMVGGNCHGVKPFLVPLSSSEKMKPGITSRILPTRPGTKPLDHSITTFEHVRLPRNALLGSISKSKDERADFLRQIWRVSIGTLSLSIMGVSAIKVGTHIAGTYSQRRTITAPDGHTRVPIMSFSTQQRPIIEGWVQAFMNADHGPLARHALATIFKSTVVRASRILNELTERCGWQGLFAYNQISELALTFQGNAIAEGDTLVLCIRLVSELLGGKYGLPAPQDPTTVLARRERQMMEAARSKLKDIGGYGEHRGQAFNQHILPCCRPIAEAIGHRMAYEAARESGACPKSSVYTNTSIGDAAVEAYDDVLADMLQSLQNYEADAYTTAPIMSDQSWASFVDKMQSFKHPSDHARDIQPKL